jgi:hypothetical protein
MKGKNCSIPVAQLRVKNPRRQAQSCHKHFKAPGYRLINVRLIRRSQQRKQRDQTLPSPDCCAWEESDSDKDYHASFYNISGRDIKPPSNAAFVEEPNPPTTSTRPEVHIEFANPKPTLLNMLTSPILISRGPPKLSETSKAGPRKDLGRPERTPSPRPIASQDPPPLSPRPLPDTSRATGQLGAGGGRRTLKLEMQEPESDGRGDALREMKRLTQEPTRTPAPSDKDQNSALEKERKEGDVPDVDGMASGLVIVPERITGIPNPNRYNAALVTQYTLAKRLQCSRKLRRDKPQEAPQFCREHTQALRGFRLTAKNWPLGSVVEQQVQEFTQNLGTLAPLGMEDSQPIQLSVPRVQQWELFQLYVEQKRRRKQKSQRLLLEKLQTCEPKSPKPVRGANSYSPLLSVKPLPALRKRASAPRPSHPMRLPKPPEPCPRALSRGKKRACLIVPTSLPLPNALPPACSAALQKHSATGMNFRPRPRPRLDCKPHLTSQQPS